MSETSEQRWLDDWETRPNIEEPLKELCHALLGPHIDYDRVARVEILPREAVVYVYSLNNDGKKHIGPIGGTALERITVKVRT